jgi:hypothetical protein
MRRAFAWCTLGLLMAAGAAWAAPVRSRTSADRLVAANLADRTPARLRASVLFGDTSIEPRTADLGNGQATLFRQRSVVVVDRRRTAIRTPAIRCSNWPTQRRRRMA